MSKTNEARSYGSATKSALRNRIDEYSEILYEDRFRNSDLDADRQTAQSIVSFLKHNNAVKSIATKRVEAQGSSTKVINIWAWSKDHQEHLQEHYESRETLPCGCRVHIPPEREGDMYICKFCGEAHDRETIRESV